MKQNQLKKLDKKVSNTSPSQNQAQSLSYSKHGTSHFQKVNLALFSGGFVTFAILYCVQPLMPVFSNEYHIHPATASLSLSVTTMTLAFCLLIGGTLSESLGRKPVMSFALLASSLLAVISALSPSFPLLLASRILLGVVLAGLPSVAMAYLSEEMDPKSLGLAMGLYISGNSIGGMGGRVITGVLTDISSWRFAIGVIGVCSLVFGLIFLVTLPPSRHFIARRLEFRNLLASLWAHLQDKRLLGLFGLSFLMMGSFVTLYNYIGYQLLERPYSLSQTWISWIFLLYIVGTFSSTWMGKLSDRYGRSRVLPIAISIMLIGAVSSLFKPLALKIVSIAIFTFGFFGGHSIASSWVGKSASHDKAQASSLYLFFYYMGSSIAGTAGGWFWGRFGWNGVAGFIIVLILLALLLTGFLYRQSEFNQAK